MKKPTRRQSLVIPLCTLAILALVSGIAYATIPGGNGQIDGCYDPGHGNLRVIDTEAGATCRSQEKPLSWSQTGPQGPVGPQGPRGPSDGYRATVLPFEAVELSPLPSTTDVISLSLPAGNFVITSTLNLQRSTSGASDVTCDHVVGGGPFGNGYHESLDGDTDAATMAITGGINLTSPDTVHVRCFTGEAGNRVPFADTTATAVGTLHTQ